MKTRHCYERHKGCNGSFCEIEIDRMTKPLNYQQAFAEWKRIAQEARQRAERIDNSIHEQGWKLAATVGIPHCHCSLHNASIDDELTGWCKDNPERLKVARKANHLVNQWPGSRIADRVIKTAWNRLIADPFGYARYDIENGGGN